jgi:signal transduction histidine kinase
VAAQKNIEICFDANDDLLAYADEEALNKIISNLMDNAIKYAGSKVNVTLSYGSSDQSWYQII